jgi:hypothetical protein
VGVVDITCTNWPRAFQLSVSVSAPFARRVMKPALSYVIAQPKYAWGRLPAALVLLSPCVRFATLS